MSTPNTNISLPDYIQPEKPLPQIRLGIMGKPGSGKTWAASTFPNAVFLNKDHKCKPGSLSIPLWDPAFCKKFGTPRTYLVKFIKEELVKLPKDHTIVLDSWTRFFDEHENWMESVKTTIFWSAKKNEIDGFKMHNDRIIYAVEIMMELNALPHNVVILFHEQVDRDNDGNAVGIRPMMRGQFADRAASHITAFFRQTVRVDKTTKKAFYEWQIKPSIEFPSAICPFATDDTTIPADYKSLEKMLLLPQNVS